MASPNLLQQLHRLDRSSPRFNDQLSNVLYGEEYKPYVEGLQNDDLVELVDYLDKALDILDPSSSAFRKCLRELRSICGSRAILTTSHILSSPLLSIGRHPVASGGSGDVYEGNLNGSKICVKRIRIYSKDGPAKATKTLYQEAVVWKHLAHPNFVPLFGVIHSPSVSYTPLQLILEWVPGGDLTEYIKKHPDTGRLNLLSDVAEDIHYLHSCNIVHGSLKGERGSSIPRFTAVLAHLQPNILVDAAGRARITDFGHAMVTENLDSIRSAPNDHRLTTRLTAPEILNEEGTYSKEVDVFSFAMVSTEVFTGAIPFNNSLPAAAMLAIMGGERPPRPTHPTLTDQLWRLIQRCWDQKPHLRPEVSGTLQVIFTSDLPTWKQLTSSTLAGHKRAPLIMAIFSDRDQTEIAGHLCGDDAQAFVDIIDEVLNSLPPRIRRRCLRTLYRICGRQAVLPRSLEIPLCYDPMGSPLCHGGFADVWKSQHDGRDVAAKALRVCSKNGFEKDRRVDCLDSAEVVTWNALRHPNVLPLLGVTMTEDRFVMASEWMAKGNINEFVKAHPTADRLTLLGDVTRGLIYMHGEGVVHGDLKGANILIDHSGHACLADFSLLTIALDQSTVISSCIGGGTIQWMNPELMDPESFGLEKTRRRRSRIATHWGW